MKILTLEVNNFLTIGHAKLALDSKGLVLVQGKNLDDASAISNGAGKSSIPDALCWALYGTTARGVTADDVVNEVAGKGCWVRVVVEDGADQYRITRHRKCTGAIKNGVEVLQGGTIRAGLSPLTLTKGTEKETQEVINTIMGCDLNVFTSSVYAAQEMMPNLPGMTDKNLKQLIESASGTEVLSAAHEKAKTELSAIQSRHQFLHSVLTAKNATLVTDLAGVTEAERLFGEYELGRVIKSNEHKRLAKISALEAKEVMKTPFDSSGIEAALHEINAKVINHNARLAELRKMRNDANICGSRYTTAKANLSGKNAFLAAAELAVTNIASKVGEPCGECGKPYHKEDLGAAGLICDKNLTNAIADVQSAELVSRSAMEEHQLHITFADDFEKSTPDITALISEERRLNGLKSDYENVKREFARLKTAAKSEINKSEVVMTELNPYKSVLEGTRTRADATTSQIKDAEDKLESVVKEFVIAKSVVNVFGPAGVRARILDTVTPYLNARTSDYLSALSDGNISAVWTTIQRNKAGDLKEKFGIDVTNDKGAKMFNGLSGGEKRKVRLSCALALQDLVSSRATKPIELFVGDEVDDALDAAGLERLMGILEEKARERGTVLIISHADLKDWVSDVCEITKEGGVSTVTGALCE